MRKTLVLAFTFCVTSAAFGQTGGGGPIQMATVTLGSSQLQNLKGTPVSLVAAPGAGQLLNVISALAEYKFGTTPYAIPARGRLNLVLGNPANYEAPLDTSGMYGAGLLDQTTKQIRFMPQASLGDSQGNFENQPLLAINDSPAEWTNGDGTVTITVYYTIVALQ